MSKKTIITGVKVTDQMAKAMEILNTEILPKENLFQDRKRKGLLNDSEGVTPSQPLIKK